MGASFDHASSGVWLEEVEKKKEVSKLPLTEVVLAAVAVAVTVVENENENGSC